MATSGWQQLDVDEKAPEGMGICRLSAAPAQRLPATDLHVGVGSGYAEPFLPAAALGPVLNAFEEWGLGDVIENEGHCSNDTC